MDEKTLRALAIAFAHAKLIQAQEKHPEKAGWNEELRNFLKWYNYASCQIPIEYDALDVHF